MGSYDARFYDTIRAGTRQSAAVVVPLLIERLELGEGDTMIDVGCGEGWWAQTFTEHGIAAQGIDGAYVASSPLGDRFTAADLSKSILAIPNSFSLALSLEVAEHLPRARAQGFVRDLCRLAPRVVFSAAIPGQGGTGHVNEQWPDYWAELFEAEGFAVSGALRFDIWNDDRIENWYRQNLLVAVPRDKVWWYPSLFDSSTTPPFPMVHPVLYDARRR